MFAKCLVRRISKQLLRPFIPALHVAVQIDGDDRFLDLIDNVGLPSYHLTRLSLCRDVGPEPDDFLWGSVRSPNQHPLVSKPAVLAAAYLPTVFRRQTALLRELPQFHEGSPLVVGMKPRGPEG